MSETLPEPWPGYHRLLAAGDFVKTETPKPVLRLRCRRKGHLLAEVFRTPLGLYFLPRSPFRASSAVTQKIALGTAYEVAAEHTTATGRFHLLSDEKAGDAVNFGCPCTMVTETVAALLEMARSATRTAQTIRLPR